MSTFKANPNDPLPLYYQVYASLRDRIDAGEFPPGSALPPERKLVNDYGVSRITVVKAMDTLERDGLIERQQGRGTFVTETETANGANGLACSIGYLPGGLLHSYFFGIQMGIADIVYREQCFLHIIGSLDRKSTRDDALFNMITNSVDGLIAYPLPKNRDVPLYRRLVAANIPLVMVDRYYSEIDADSVTFDDEQAGYELTQALIARGHERIAIMTHYEVDASSIRHRITGYRRAIKEHDLPASEDLTWLDVYAGLRPARGLEGDNKMTADLRAHIETYQPTAIVAVNHDVARRLTHDLMMINTERARLAIYEGASPDFELDVEIAAFGYQEPASYGPFNVATALQPGEILGRRAAELLISRLDGTFTGPPQAIKMPIEIVSQSDCQADRQDG